MSELGEKLELELLESANFPKRVQFMRLRNKETMGTLGKKIGRSDAAVWQWEHGNNMPQPKVMIKLAEALGVNVAWLQDGKGEMLAPVPVGAQLSDPATAQKVEGIIGVLGPDNLDQPDRIRWARDLIGIHMGDLATKIGIGKSTLGFYCLKLTSPYYRPPSKKVIQKLADALQVNRKWLEHGYGEKSKLKKPEPPPVPKSVNKGLSSRLHECSVVRGLTSAEIGDVIGQARGTFTKHASPTGKNPSPRDHTIHSYARLFAVSFAWLKHGEGERPFPMPEFEEEHFGERLDAAREYCGLTWGEVAELGGQAFNTVSAYHSSTGPVRVPTHQQIGKYAKALDVNFEWLFGGTGPMVTEPAPEAPEVTEPVQQTVPTPVESPEPEVTPVPDTQESAPAPEPDEQPPTIEITGNAADWSEPKIEDFPDIDDVQAGLVAPAPDLTDLESPARRYFEEPKVKVQVVEVRRDNITSVATALQTAIDERDEHYREAEACQSDVDKWTAILMNQVL